MTHASQLLLQSTTGALLTVAAIAVVAMPAQAARTLSFQDLDADKSGMVTESEYVAQATKEGDSKAEAKVAFNKIDANNDGMLSISEVKKGNEPDNTPPTQQ